MSAGSESQPCDLLETICIFDAEQSLMSRFNTDRNCGVFTHSQTLRVVFPTLPLSSQKFMGLGSASESSVFAVVLPPSGQKLRKQASKQTKTTKEPRERGTDLLLNSSFGVLGNLTII